MQFVALELARLCDGLGGDEFGIAQRRAGDDAQAAVKCFLPIPRLFDYGSMNMPRMTLAKLEELEKQIAAAASASDADDRLASMLKATDLNWYGKVKVVVALGDVAPGLAGSEILRSVFDRATDELAEASKATRPGYLDLVCACVIALAKRDGPAATDVYIAALQSPNPTVQEYGVSALAVAGDDRSWDERIDRLSEMLLRKTSLRGWHWREECRTIEYLARHSPRAPGRATRLVSVLRKHWNHLADTGLISSWWPGIEPGGQPVQALDLARHNPELWVARTIHVKQRRLPAPGFTD